jgi:uncharacterized protein YndB with AHSA1/START domain
MVTTKCYVQAAPQDVFAVLANGWHYSGWFVGTSHMRAVEEEWPAAGSRVFHARGAWPASFPDETQVEEVTTNERLLLTAGEAPMGKARVEITLAANGDGTSVTMSETPLRGRARWMQNPCLNTLTARRNLEALARLKAIVERPTPS